MSDLKHQTADQLRDTIRRTKHQIEVWQGGITYRQGHISGAQERLRWAVHYLAEKTAKPPGMSQLATDWLEGRAREFNPDQCAEFARSGAIGIDIKPLPCSFWALASIRSRAYWQFVCGRWSQRQIAIECGDPRHGPFPYVTLTEFRDTLLGQIEADPGVDWTHDSVRCFGQPIHKQTRKVDGHMMVQLGDQHHTRFDLTAEFRKKVILT